MVPGVAVKLADMGRRVVRYSNVLKVVFVGMAGVALVACNGSSSSTPMRELPHNPIPESVKNSPDIARLSHITKIATETIIPSVHYEYNVSVGNIDASESLDTSISCIKTECTGEIQSVYSVEGKYTKKGQVLFAPYGPEVELSETTLGSKSGLSTGTFTTKPNWFIPRVIITSLPKATSYGVWGEHGAVFVEVMDTEVSVRDSILDDANMGNGRLRLVLPSATIHSEGENPAGMGSATWNGVANAVAVGTLERREGTVSLTVPDLSVPTISASVDVEGYDIGSPLWSGMALEKGMFSVGTQGDDYISGGFAGSGHEEVYGAFDVGEYVGAFGAARVGEQ